MLRRLLLIAAFFSLVTPLTAESQTNRIRSALEALNNQPERFSTPEQAEATTKEFFELVRADSGREDAIAVLKELKGEVPNAEWRDGMRRAENRIMRTVQQTLDATIVEAVKRRTSKRQLGSILGYGYSGKWPLKPETQLTFDGDFDASFFGLDRGDTDPRKGIIAEVSGKLFDRLGAKPSALSVVLNGYGWEAKAEVYVTSAGKTWAIRESMTRLYLIDTVTGAPIEITGYPDFLYYETQMQLLARLHPEFFENGRLRQGVTQEEIRQTLMEDPRLGRTFKLWLAGTRYTPGQAAAGVIDMACHVAETVEATTPLERRAKVAKQMARSNNIFLNAMDGTKLPWRVFFSENDIQFMRECANLDRAKITFAEAEAKRIDFLLAQRQRTGAATGAELEQYRRLKVEAETARGELGIAERLVMDAAGSETAFVQRSVNLMRRQAQVAHREFVIDVMGRPAAERSRLLVDYEMDLRALLDHYGRKANVPREAIEWAQGAYDSVKELSRVASANERALEGFGPRFMRVWEMFNSPVNTRENVRKLLGETPMGRALLERIPEWAFASERPAALTDIAFDAPTKMVAEVVVAPVNQTVNALMMIDLLLQLSDVLSSDQTEVQKLVSCGGIVAMMVVPHLYLVPMVYHASLTGDPKQVSYVVACYICPPALLPMLVESLGTRAITGARKALFQSELEAMFQASAFTPEDGKEPKEWATSPDAIRYAWIALNTELDSYGREGERNLADYIRILASDTRSEIPLSQQKKMSGLQAIYMPGAVAKTFRAMIEDGDHRLFRENNALGNALVELQKFNCDWLVPFMYKAPAYCRYAWAEQKSGIRLDLINNQFATGEMERLKAEGKAGENRVKIVSAMLAQRAKLQDQVIVMLSEAIIVSFEEEKRARKLVEMGLLDESLKELLEIGRELAIEQDLKEAVVEDLRREGVKLTPDQMDKATGKMTDKSRQDTAKVTDRWVKSYRYIAETRRSLVGLLGGYGVPKTEIDHFLRGKPPLEVKPDKDLQITQTNRDIIMNSPKDASGILFRLKGNSREPHPLDSEAEATLLKYLFTARVMQLMVDEPYGMIPPWQEGPAEEEKAEAYAERLSSALKRQLEMKGKTLWSTPSDSGAYLDRYFVLARGYAWKFAELRDKYRGEIQLATDGPTEVEEGTEVNLRAMPTRVGKPMGDALGDIRIEWVVGQSVQNRGLTWRFSPVKAATLSITVNAVRDAKGKPVIVATATHVLVIKKKPDDRQPEPAQEPPGGPPDSGAGTEGAGGKGELSFSGTAFDIWEGGNTPEGFLLRRIEAKGGRISEPCPHPAGVWAEAWGRLDRAWSLRTQEDIAKKLNEELEGYKALRWSKEGAIRNISLGDFKGLFLDTKIRFGSGGWSPDMGFSPCSIDASGHGYVMKGERVVELFYSVGGSGCFDNSQRPYLESQAAAAQGEARSIIASLRLVEGGVLSKVPYTGPKLDGSDLPRVVLAPALIERLKVGDVVKIQAVVENAKPEDSPFKYTWTGDFHGSGSTVSVKATKPGKFTLSVSVDGARYNLGSASVEYDVADLRVRIERVPPDTRPVPVGTKTGFKATLTSDGRPAGGTFVYRWQPHPEVAFDELDANVPDVHAAFPKPGRVKVWVQVLEKREGREATVAESEQLEIEVVKPQLDVAFEPNEPYVGQEVRAKLAVKPEMKEIDFRWMPVPGNAKQTMLSKDGREITFYLKDDRPAEIRVMARVPKSGEDLGEAKGAVKARKYAVSVTGPKAHGPKPRVWKEGVGLVDVENAIAVDQIVEFAADVQPNPSTGPVKYQWSVTSGPCTVSNPTSRETSATAGSAGGCELTVAVRDKNDVQLGEGKGSFSASVTRETIATGQKKAKDAAEAKTKVQDARGKISQGKLDEAIADLDAAVKLDPANGEAKQLSQKVRSDTERIRQQLDRAKKFADENRFVDASRELTVASNINSNYPPVQQASRELSERQRAYENGVQGKIREVRAASEQKEFGRALEIAAAWRASTKLDPNAESALRQQEDYARQMKARKDRQISILKQACEKTRNYDYAGALKGYEQGFAGVQSLFNGREPEYQEAVKLRSEAYAKNQRLQELIPWVQRAAEGRETMTVDALQKTLKTADEAVALQPTNEQLKKWRAMIAAKAKKGADDDARIAQGRKHLEAAQSAERSFLSIDSRIRSGPSPRWDEKSEMTMQDFLVKAIENYRESLKFIPDAAVEKHIRELEANLEARKKFLENVRLSKRLRAEGDQLAREARSETSFEASQEKFTRAVDLYNRSLGLYRPPDVQILQQTVSVLGMEKLSRAYKKHFADCSALARAGRIAEALAACERAAASRYPHLSQHEWWQLEEGIRSLRKQLDSAKRWRAQGEAEERAGKIAAAVTSYRNSLKNVPDAALEQHVGKLETGLAGKGTADRLWQEGTGLYGQGQYDAALGKFKESLGQWSDATRSNFVRDLESRRARAKQLISEGEALQKKKQLQAAIGKYRESLAYWPDKQLENRIRQLETEIASAPPVVPPSLSPPPSPTVTSGQSAASGGSGPTPPQPPEPAAYPAYLTSKVWQFGRSDGTVLAAKLRLMPDGRIEGSTHTNESRWAYVKKELIFYDSAGKVATRYNSFRQEGGRWVISGPFLLWGDITHVLKEVGDLSPRASVQTDTATTGTGASTLPTPAPPPRTTCDVNISGTWVSNINVEYTIQQTGCRFSWYLKRYDETCEGTIDGRVISARYSGRQGTASVKGKVSRYDSAGRPLTIQWEDGSTFNRRP